MFIYYAKCLLFVDICINLMGQEPPCNLKCVNCLFASGTIEMLKYCERMVSFSAFLGGVKCAERRHAFYDENTKQVIILQDQVN